MCPCRTSMKLCSESTFLPTSSRNATTALDEMPCASGVLRGSGLSAAKLLAARQSETAHAISDLMTDSPEVCEREPHHRCSGVGEDWRHPRGLYRGDAGQPR